MDNFFAKKGIALSRQPPQSSQHIKQQIIKSQNEMQRQFISQTPKPAQIKINQNQWGHLPSNTHLVHFPQQNQKSFSVQNPINLNQQYPIPTKHTFLSAKEGKQLQPEIMPKRQSYFFQQQARNHRQSFPQMKSQFQSISTDDQTQKSFFIKPLQFEQLGSSQQINQLSNLYLRNKMADRKDLSFEIVSPRKSATTSYEENQLKRQLQQAMLKQKIMVQAMKTLEKQKQELTKRLREGSPTKSYWIEQKIKLLKELDQKNNYIKDLEIKMDETKRESKIKINMLQYEVKKLQSMKNRLHIESQNSRKLLEIERKKNDTAQNKMDKLMFFQDDLIHAKDYSKLKKQLDDVLTQNSRMFQDHQKYILQVGETRRKMNQQLESVEQQLSKLKGQAFQWRAKIYRLNINSDDKRQLIKLQHDINFLMKKIEQSRQQMIQREHSLEEAHQQIKQLNDKQNKRIESNQHILDGLNLKQFSDTIALYQSRIQDLNNSLFISKSQIQKQKKTIESLTSQLRRIRQDTHINSMRQKSHESSLKNDLMVLEHTYKSQQELNRKKITTLQENIQRKTKQIVDKDKFIKHFLINRAKKIETESMKEILDSVKEYFHVQPQPNEEPQRNELSQHFGGSENIIEPQSTIDCKHFDDSSCIEILINSEEPQEESLQNAKGVDIDV